MTTDPPTPDDQVTAEFPAIGDEDTRRDSIMPWLIVGGVIGILALVIFAGGLRDPGTPTGGSATTATAPTTTATAPVTAPNTTTVPSSAHVPDAVPLEVRATDPQGVAVEVRKTGPNGAVVFAGTLAQGEVRTFAIARGLPLWLSLAWAPSAAVRVDGVPQDTTGGTETYMVTQSGLRRLTGTTSR
ncbi:MAG TPA: hypothetical protein PLV41_11365, partial [Miltoncostaeales bacterium]|jgi:hypothetical protein|nr:hypothetical protein [Miltoncostaeales bacterium]